ncbi:MAG: VOC family protein [Flavobacteriales bacterium]
MSSEFRFVLVANDFNRSVEFYHLHLGLPMKHSWDRGPGQRGALFIFSNGIIEILEKNESQQPAAPNGIWLYVQVDDVDAWYKKIHALDLPVKKAPENTSWGHRKFTLVDPNGILIGLFSVI